MKNFTQNSLFVTQSSTITLTHSKMVALMVMIAICIITLGFQTTFAHAATGCPIAPIAPTTSQNNVAKMIEEINIRRAELGVPPMKLSQSLTDSALYHAVDMQADNYFKRGTFDRDANDELVKQCGVYKRIESFYGEIAHAAEMIASGDFGNDTDATDSVLDIMVQINQYNKLMEGVAWEFGMGYAEAPMTGFEKWVLTVGRRNTVFPMIINHEQMETEAQDVEIYMYGEWEAFRLQNNDGNWSQWYNFDNTTNTIGWSLDRFAETQTVQIEVMAADGTTYTTSDSIVYSPEMVEGRSTTGDVIDTPIATCGNQVCSKAQVETTVNVPLAVGLNGMNSSVESNVNTIIMMLTLFVVMGTIVAHSTTIQFLCPANLD